MRSIAVTNGLTIYGSEPALEALLLPYVGSVKAGFPTPAENYIESDIDLVEFLGMNKPTVYIVRVDGTSMEDQHVPDKSYLIVDKALRPQPHDLVVAVLNGDFTVKILVKSSSGWILYPANAAYDPIIIKEGDDFQVWGVVAQVIIDRREKGRRG